MPLAAVHHRRAGLQLLLDGRRVALRLGIHVAAVDDLPLEVLRLAEEALSWFPAGEKARLS
jgi:hypothetical protein